MFAGMPNSTASAAIALDTGFGGGGTVRTDFSGNIDEARAVVLQQDGKIVAAGSSFSSAKTVEDFVVARYNSNGSLDKRFGNNGKVITDFFRNVDSISAVAIQPDGKIVVGGFAQLGGSGSTPRVFALARFNSDGSPDSSFGSGGKLTTSFGGSFASVSSIMLQPDGKIIAAGTADFNPRVPGAGLDFALARYQPNGGLDGSFGDAGKLTFDFFGSFNQANAAALQSDGKIVVVGGAAYDNANRSIGFALARFNPNGSPDAVFGSGGKQITDFFGTGGQANGVVIQPDGKIVVAGTASDNASRFAGTDFALARYNPDGSLDDSFGSGGRASVPLPDSTTEQANALALAPDGKIIVAGAAYKSFATPPDFALARYKQDGSLDEGFGSGGVLTTDFAGGTDEAFAVAIQPNGNLVAAGRAFRNNFDLALARYLDDAAPAPVPVVAADLSVSAGGAPNPVIAGDNLTYTVNTVNNGPSAATNVTLTDTLPADVSLVSATSSQGACSGLNVVTCNLGTMASGAGASVTIVVTTAAVGTLTNAVSITGSESDPNLNNNTVTTVTTVQSVPVPGPTPTPTPVPAATPVLVSLALSPGTVTAPAPSTGTVTLSLPAPDGGLAVSLTSSDARKASLPATVTVPAGATTASFTITTFTSQLGGGQNPVTITATLAAIRKSATLVIIRP
jgi:uncharacterized delta-60 repeat protein/uncharacterized repeat protein (TIGR01451 family)